MSPQLPTTFWWTLCRVSCGWSSAFDRGCWGRRARWPSRAGWWWDPPDTVGMHRWWLSGASVVLGRASLLTSSHPLEKSIKSLMENDYLSSNYISPILIDIDGLVQERRTPVRLRRSYVFLALTSLSIHKSSADVMLIIWLLAALWHHMASETLVNTRAETICSAHDTIRYAIRYDTFRDTFAILTWEAEVSDPGLRSEALHSTDYNCLRSNDPQWLQQWRPPRSFQMQCVCDEFTHFIGIYWLFSVVSRVRF